jgi:hypothetical protein
VRKVPNSCLKDFTGNGIGDSIACYRDSGRGRKTSLGTKTHSERYPGKINLGEIRPESESSEEDSEERYPDEIDPRKSFREY